MSENIQPGTGLEQDRERLRALQSQFEVAGGRGVELAEEIDDLRRKIAFHGKKFYRTVITVEVLSDSPYDPDSLEDVSYDILDGDYSGDWSVSEVQEVDAERMVDMLAAQGSDPNFLFGDPEDWDVDGEDTAADDPYAGLVDEGADTRDTDWRFGS